MLRGKKSTNRYLKEILSLTTAIVQSSDWSKLQAAAARLGLLIDPPDPNENQQSLTSLGRMEIP